MQNIDNKYFTPEIQDIHVGYECEIFEPQHNKWSKGVIGNLAHIFTGDIKDNLNRYRTPYLTKEQIESEGWKFKGKSVDLWWEKEGDFNIGNWTSYKIVIHYGMKGHVGNQDLRLYIHAEDITDEHHLFEGECKDINTFRKICRLLKI